MRLRAVVAAATLLAAVACSPSKPEPVRQAAPPTDQPALDAGRVVYAWHGSVWLYDAGADRSDELAVPPRGVRYEQPRFAGAKHVSYVESAASDPDASPVAEQTAIVLRTLAGGATQVLVRTNGRVLATAWTRDGATLAYLTTDYDGPEPHTIRLFDLASRTTKVLRTFPQHEGRGVSQDDDVSLEWSPDGTRLLVTDTHLDATRRTVFLLDRAGRDVIPPTIGTYATWSRDGAWFAMRSYEEGTPTWWRVTGKGERTDLGMRGATVRAAFSPDGRYIATDDGAAEPRMFIFDTQSGKTATHAGSVFAIWLDRTSVAASDTRRCSGESECNDYAMWVATGTSSVIDPSGAAHTIRLATTEDADVRYA
jgi:hypothetical protein